MAYNDWLLGKCLAAGVLLHSYGKEDVPVVPGHGVPLKEPGVPRVCKDIVL